jgi:hypothetical protein
MSSNPTSFNLYFDKAIAPYLVDSCLALLDEATITKENLPTKWQEFVGEQKEAFLKEINATDHLHENAKITRSDTLNAQFNECLNDMIDVLGNPEKVKQINDNAKHLTKSYLYTSYTNEYIHNMGCFLNGLAHAAWK